MMLSGDIAKQLEKEEMMLSGDIAKQLERIAKQKEY